MDPLIIALIGMGSVISAGLTMGIGAVGSALGEGNATNAALLAIAQQPDLTNTIRGTLFVAMAMIESMAIFALLVAMILIFANPFWDFATANAILAH